MSENPTLVFIDQGTLLAIEGPGNPRFKTEMCRNFMERAKCAYGEHCQYAHGRREAGFHLQDHNI